MPIYPEVEFKTYDAMEATLRKHHEGKFVVIKGENLHGAYDTFDAAAAEAERAYGRGPYLIREVKDQTEMTMPASIAFRHLHASR